MALLSRGVVILSEGAPEETLVFAEAWTPSDPRNTSTFPPNWTVPVSASANDTVIEVLEVEVAIQMPTQVYVFTWTVWMLFQVRPPPLMVVGSSRAILPESYV